MLQITPNFCLQERYQLLSKVSFLDLKFITSQFDYQNIQFYKNSENV